MKRLLAIAFAAALLAQAALSIAQESAQAPAEPSEKSALKTAREKYAARRKAESKPAEAEEEGPAAAPESSAQAEEALGAEAAEAPPREARVPYTAIQLSVVPGLSFPRRTHDVSLAAGLFGSRVRDVSGVQASGFFSIARDVRGAQDSGAFNIARDVRGAQAAGAFNIARDIHGAQLAGLFNAAGEVEGAQIGLVNFAKRVDGVQIGLLNFAKNGIHSLGFAYEPRTSYAYAYWQSGMPALYTRWGIGARCGAGEFDSDGAVASLGLGTRRSIYFLDVDMDVSAECALDDGSFGRAEFHHERRGRDREWEGAVYYPRAYPSFRIEASLPLGDHWRIFGGVKADVDCDYLGDRVPEELKRGESWSGRLWGERFTVWPKWFFGLKI